MSKGVLCLYVDAKSVERDEAYEYFSAACRLFLDKLHAVAVWIADQECLVDSESSIWNCRDSGRDEGDASGL